MNIEGAARPPCLYWGNNSVFDELKEHGMEKLAESGILERLEKLKKQGWIRYQKHRSLRIFRQSVPILSDEREN